MKIAYTGLDLPQGKIKFNDEILVELVKNFQPKKVSPYYFEFFPDNYELADLIMINNECLLDLLILDIEKIEGRLTRTKDLFEIEILEKSLVQLDDQKPICDLRWDDTEQAVIKALGLLSLTPTLVYEETSADIK